jgi:hypothetical protein
MKKINKLIALLGIAILAVSMTACSSGPQTTESRAVSGINTVSISTFGEFVIRQGNDESLTIEAPSNYLRYIDTKVEDGVLHIDARRGFIPGPARKVLFTLTVKNLNGLYMSGAGKIEVLGNVTSDNFTLNLTGAGSVEIDSLNANNLTVNFSSAGAMVVAGNVDNQSVNLSGVGSYEAGDLQSKHTSLNLSGAGSATVWAVESLDVNISGVGSLGYYGSPRITQNITGLGSVNSKGAHR